MRLIRDLWACIAVVLALGAGMDAQATSSVSFEARGYLLDFVVGDDSRPAIAGLSFAAPGSTRAVQIPLRHLKVESFDTRHKTVLLRFSNPGDAALPADFSLTVRGDAGVLRINGQSFTGRFSWGP
ncbi:MAG: hypothetical protein AB7I35_08160 [Ramlibacter sp.]